MADSTYHVVKTGETVGSIAKIRAVDIVELSTHNGLRKGAVLTPGQILVLPAQRDPTSASMTCGGGSKKPMILARQSSLPAKISNGYWLGMHFVTPWQHETLSRLRSNEANENLQRAFAIRTTCDTYPPGYEPSTSKKKGSQSKRKFDEEKAALKEKLGKEPHIVVFDGVSLSLNEKKQLVASTALCEMNADVFGSINDDQEFVGRKYGKKGIGGLTYSRIAHIGLSYGLVQFTQDSGVLGRLLLMMCNMHQSKFIQVFGGGDSNIAGDLLTLTTTGRADLVNDPGVPLSGQVHWNDIRKSELGKELTKLANGDDGSNLPVEREIRGKRVQPIPANKGDAPTDLWDGVWKQRFLDAGIVPEFQDIQLEFAVKEYFDPILKRAKAQKVRSALGLAFMLACSLRGGPNGPLVPLLFDVADEIKVSLPFGNSEDERRCLDSIAEATGYIGSTKVLEDETRRARLLIQDEFGFLNEDLYDVSTYV